MLTKKQIQDAVRYNSKRILDKKLDINSLPWPWDRESSAIFAWATALFQSEASLATDGKMGPGTTKALTPRPSQPPKVIAPEMCSNAIIVNGNRVRLPGELLEAGLTASNYRDDNEPHFKCRQRSEDLIHFVLHETCGNTASGCMDTLKKKGYGVQLILAPNGHLSCHGDLVLDRMVHANQLNDTSFGVEIVNPYAPRYVRDKSIFSKIISAEWWTWCPKPKKGPKDKRYVTPTPLQMAAIRLLVPWLCKVTGVPYRLPTKGLNKKKRQIDGLTLKPRGRPGSGVVAHRDFAGHADGRYVLEDLIGRKDEK